MQGFARATTYIPSLVSFTTTGDIDNLDFMGADLIRMNNATDATIRGLVAGTAGQRVTIVSIGAGNVFLAHQNTNSTEANRLINTATSGNTPLAAGTGKATYQYDATTARWRLIAHEQGTWISPAFAAGDFTGNGSMTWTVEAGDVTTQKYLLVGKTLTFAFYIGTTTIGGTPNNQLRIAIPNGFAATSATINQVLLFFESGSFGFGFVQTLAAATLFQLVKSTAAAWASATNATEVYGTAIVEVN